MPQPELVPIPISSYAVSAEAIAHRATSPSTVAKGVAIVGGAVVLGAITAFVKTVGFRGVLMMDAPAMFGIATDNSPVSSDRDPVI